MRILLLLLCLVSSGAWGADYHVCVTASGSGDGSSEANCRAGYVGGFAPGAGDHVTVHPGGYYEKLIVTNSGTVAAPSVWEFLPGAFIFESIDISGEKSISATATETTVAGNDWEPVGGGIVRKGINYFYYFYVDGRLIEPGPRVYTNEADVLANLPANRWTIISRTTNTFTRAVYFNGSETADMRGNRIQASSVADNGCGEVVLNGVHDIELRGLEARSYYANYLEQGALCIVNSSNIVVDDCDLHDGQFGGRIFGGRDVTIQNCNIYNNYGSGFGISGSEPVEPGGVANQISGITRANPAVVTTVGAHGLSNGEKVIPVTVGGMIEVSYGSGGSLAAELTIANVTANTFELVGVNSSAYTPATGTGRLFVQRGATNHKFLNNRIYSNGNYPRWNGINFAWGGDSDGLGIGYLGGVVTNLRIEGNSFIGNGPARALNLAIESGDINRGAGIYFGTSFTMPVSGASIISNVFENNTRLSLSYGDAESGTIFGNAFLGTRQFVTDVANTRCQVSLGAEHLNTGTYTFINNTIANESGLCGVSVDTSRANSTYKVHNNVFVNVGPSTGNAATFGAFRYTSAVNSAGLTESHNRFVNTSADALYRAVSTYYTTVASYQSATSKGASDEVITDPGFVDGTSPTTVDGFCLDANSALLGAGTYIGAYVLGYEAESFPNPPPIGARGTCAGRASASTRSAATR